METHVILLLIICAVGINAQSQCVGSSCFNTLSIEGASSPQNTSVAYELSGESPCQVQSMVMNIPSCARIISASGCAVTYSAGTTCTTDFSDPYTFTFSNSSCPGTINFNLIFSIGMNFENVSASLTTFGNASCINCSMVYGPVSCQTPVTTQAFTTVQLTTKALTTMAVTTTPLTTTPLTTIALTTQPVTTIALTTQPLTTTPLTTQALTTNPLTTQPLTTIALTTQPLTTKPLTTQILTTAFFTTTSQPPPPGNPLPKASTVFALTFGSLFIIMAGTTFIMISFCFVFRVCKSRNKKEWGDDSGSDIENSANSSSSSTSDERELDDYPSEEEKKTLIKSRRKHGH